MAEGHSYLYKHCLPVGFLGLVDDIIGVTEAGLNAQKMNAFINIKTAEKNLAVRTFQVYQHVDRKEHRTSHQQSDNGGQVDNGV